MCGVLSRELPNSFSQSAKILTVEEYEALPDPDFRDYFLQVLQASGVRRLLRQRGSRSWIVGLSPHLRRGVPWRWAFRRFPSIPMETCRGWWWARGSSERRRAFCGDMQAIQPHLQKSPSTALAQVRGAAREYNPENVYLTDRLASPSLATGFWDKLATDRSPLTFSTEATGSVSREMVRLLRGAGARIVQLGIESFDACDLRAMGKPTTVIHNIATLRHFAELGMWPFWSYLGPAPGSQVHDSHRVAEIIRCVTHLAPPNPPGVKAIAIYLYSRYFENSALYGLGRLRSLPRMRTIYPLPEQSLQRLAHDFIPEAPPARDLAVVKGAILAWVKVHWRSHLLFIAGRRAAWLLDTLPHCNRPKLLRRLKKEEASIYECCHEPEPLSMVCGYSRRDGADVARILDRFIREGTMLSEGGVYLSLAVAPSSQYLWYRQTSPSDLLSRYPLTEGATIATHFGLSFRAATALLSGMVMAKIVSVLLSVRWCLGCLVVRATALLLRRA